MAAAAESDALFIFPLGHPLLSLPRGGPRAPKDGPMPFRVDGL
jgi:hypothetical protein